MTYQSILQPALDMLSILNDPHAGIPAILAAFQNNNFQIKNTARDLTSPLIIQPPILGQFADPGFLQAIQPGTSFAGNSAIGYLYAVASIENKANLLVHNLQQFQQLVVATHSNLLAYASKNSDPPAVNSLSQPEQDSIQQACGISYQALIQKNWDSLLDPSLVNLDEIYLGKFPQSGLLEYSPPGASQDLKSALGKIDQAIDNHFRPWATAVQILLENFLDNVKSLLPDSLQHLYTNFTGFTSDQVATLARLAPQGVTTLDNGGTVLALVNMPTWSPPFDNPLATVVVNSLLAKGTAQEIDKQVHNLVTADNLLPIEGNSVGITPVDVEGIQNPLNAQALLDFDSLPDIHPEFMDREFSGHPYGYGASPVPGTVTTEMVDPQTGHIVSQARSGEEEFDPNSDGDQIIRDTAPTWYSTSSQ